MSISKVTSSQQPESTPFNPSQIKPLVIKFRDQISRAEEYENPTFVDEVAKTIKELYETSAGISNKPSELINNLHAMLNAPLLMEDHTEMSLYEASQPGHSQNLQQILKMHVHLPSARELFVNELSTLASDL